jgi:tetratricopeptide (TPR) repeat protein
VPSDAELQKLVTLYNQGRIDEALVSANELLAANPRDAMLHNMAGVLSARLSSYEDALEHYDKALIFRPDYAEASNNRGNTLASLGRFDDAIASFRRALEKMPDYVAAHNNLGSALHAAGRYGEAVQSLQQALRLKPDYAEAHNNLGNSLAAIGRHDDAIRSFSSALRYQPTLAQAHVGMGRALNELGYHREAIGSIRKGIELDGRSATWHNDLGNAFSDFGNPDEAVQSYRAALALDPEMPQIHSNLGNVLCDLGRYDDAAASYETALQLQPNFAEAHFNLSVIRSFSESDTRFERLQALAQTPTLSESDRCYLNFALGKAYEDIGDLDQSFVYLQEGNRLRKAILAYDIGTDRAQIEQIRSLNVPKLEETDEAVANPRPIFIVGMPRSGTTLAEQILASHSDVHGAGELRTAARILEPLLRHLESQRNTKVDAAVISRLRKEYLYETRLISEGAPVVVDKMPGNFRFVNLLLAAFPEARVVNMKRNPVATCWSMYKRLLNGNGFTNDLQDLGEYYVLYDELMADWRERFPERVFELDYEILTENQAAESRRLLEYCGLPWEDACLEFHKTQRTVRTASGNQVRQKMYTGSSEAWRKYENHLGPLLSALKANT